MLTDFMFACLRMILSCPGLNPWPEPVFVGSFQGLILQMCNETYLFLEIDQDAFVED